MENEHGEGRRRDRLMGKFFGGGKDKAEKERDRQFKTEQSANDISAFLGTNDRLQVTHPPPPPPSHGHREYDRQQPQLALDTSRATRYPAALEVEENPLQSLVYRTRSHSPPRTRKKKGLVVRFVDSYPDVIGEGGDECETAVAEIGRRKRSTSVPLSAPVRHNKQTNEYGRPPATPQGGQSMNNDDGFTPSPIRRTQTGYNSIHDFRLDEPRPAPIAPGQPSPQPRTLPAGETSRSRFLDTSEGKDENRRSFIELHQQEQRQAEGMAFAEAMRSASDGAHNDWNDQGNSSSPEPVRTTQRTMRKDAAPAPMEDSLPPLPPPIRAQSPSRSQSPFRAQSTRNPPPQVIPHEDRPPMRAQSTRMVLPPLMADPTQPQQPPQLPPQQPPPRNPARRSPLPLASVNEAAPPANPSARSPLPAIPTDQGPPDVFMNESVRSQRPMSPGELRLNTGVENSSPSSTYSGSLYSTSDVSYKATPITQNPRDRGFSTQSPEKPQKKFQEQAAGETDDAYGELITRTRHLYELFRLHAEQLKPLGSCKPEDLCRAALWWFLKGRMGVETAMRTRGGDPDEPSNLMNRYQAYTDLTKGYWLTEQALPEIAEGKYSPVDGGLGEIRQALRINMGKLAGSMKRNGLLPPEEPFMPQMVDKSIWIEYPTLSQDIVSLLNGNWGSLLAASSQSNNRIHPLEALPVGDSAQYFNYGRVPAEVYLMEQGMESMQTYFPCILSIVRPANDAHLVFAIASQNGCVSLRIQSDKNAGPTWENLRWRTDSSSLELKMPRGFLVAIQCSPTDFRMLWNIFDFGAKVQSYLYPRKDEVVAFQTKLRGFHYFDADPNARTFPKELVGQCNVGLYERTLKKESPTGIRTFHRGFRLAVVTGPRTRTLSGVTHFYPPQMPIQFAYLRGEQREPMIQLGYTSAKEKCKMVLSFNDDGEREKFITLLKGSYIHNDEELITEVALQGFNISEGLQDTKGGFQALQHLPWQLARIINDKYSGETPRVVLSEKLRLDISSMDAKGIPVGTITDRVNMAPGEFKIRLGTKDILTLQALRNPQDDMTISVIDRPGLTDAPREFSSLQSSIAQSSTVRTYRFNSFKDLHAFQAGITGYTVLFDGIASSLNISRRRMVVPVYKKWESGTARIQIVQQDKTVQLLAFFENWHHGQCMGLVLKGTDVFESSGRGGKAGVKLVDAKFPLPRVPEEGAQATDDLAFVCLDMPDYAGEHDDISIVFEDEAERDKLCACLPAPVKGVRLSKINK